MNPVSTDPTSIVAPDLLITLLKSGAMLSLVLGVLIALLFLIKRFFYNQGGSSQRGIIRMLASHYLAPKERVILLDVLGEKILIGVTPQSISCLARLDNDQEIEIPDNAVSNRFFSNLLKGVVTKRSEGNK